MKLLSPEVSVCIMTYNHEKFIAQTLNGVIMQMTSFPFEIVIGEDLSTDNTRFICEEYANTYNDKINLLPSEKNYGMVPNFLRILNQCKGQYIALVEGDDYWIDPLKLEQQFNVLNKNPDCSICFHNAFVLWDKMARNPMLFNSQKQKGKITFFEILDKWSMATSSIMFRKKSLLLPEWFPEIKNWDWLIQLLLLEESYGIYIDKIMSVYRKHSGGNSFNPDYSDDKTLIRKIELVRRLNEHLNYKYKDLINLKIKEYQKSLQHLKLRKKSKIIYYLSRPIYSIHKIKKMIKNRN